MSTTVNYVSGAERPALTINMLDETNSTIDLTGYTCTLKLGLTSTTTALTKSSGIVGSTTGITVTWSAGELALPAGSYIGEITASSGGLDYRRQFSLVITAALA